MQSVGLPAVRTHNVDMATWQQFSDEAPELAAAIAGRFTAHKHHILATLRKDGSPRVSGTELEIFHGQLILGSMIGAVKVRDLQRDPRFAIHSNPGHHSMEGGDAKVSGHARELVGDEKDTMLNTYPEHPGEAHIVALDIDEAVLTTVSDDHLYVDLWRPGQRVERFTR